MFDTKPEDWQMPVPMRLVDVAEEARQMYGAEKTAEMFPNLPEHDWRFEARLPSGATVSFGRAATAADVAAYLAREGVELGGDR
ncbi:hypothetical protein MED01_002331 [Micromonospora sp. MED01]|uniref:hypothetical protein n=1 Tax=Micromonospora alfalfae TaxID=2911212 RepID=UPI001EE97549|nr:hypothetical protein [Micromonospora alfalfae]MCG5464166.1 hypothetical protein [Micromonospora alfalfae]